MGVLDRSVAILDAVEAGAGTLGEVVEATGLTRPTAHRLASALESHGLIGRGPGRRWVLGPRLLALASTAAGEMSLREIARPALVRLQRSTGESAQLFVRVGDRRVCVEVAESSRELRTIVPLGAALPLTAGSAGKVFLAWARVEDVDRLLRRLERFTPRTLTDPYRLLTQLKTARRRGWAESVEEREPGVTSVSAPVLDRFGHVLAVVSVSGPVQRTGRTPGKHYANAAMAAARDIERALGVGPRP